MIPNTKIYSYEEYLEITKNIECTEYINGKIYYMSPSLSTEHQSVSLNLLMEFGAYYRQKECKVFHAPYDVLFEDEETGDKQVVQPDIVVVCDKTKLTTSCYKGTPTLIVEILYPATAAKDTIEKMNLYMKYGVEEYWIVKPKSKVIEIYNLEDGIYTEPMVYSKDDMVKSNIFKDLLVELKDVFK